jgi:hypothetical protein
MATSITAPAGLLSVLKTTVSADAQYDFYQAPAGKVTTSPPVIGKTGRIAVFLVPPNSTLTITGRISAALVTPGAANSITKSTVDATTAGTQQQVAIASLFGFTGAKASVMSLTQHADIVKVTCDATLAGIIIVMPSATVYSEAFVPDSTTFSSSTVWIILAVGIVLVCAGGGAAWYVRRKRRNAANATDIAKPVDDAE